MSSFTAEEFWAVIRVAGWNILSSNGRIFGEKGRKRGKLPGRKRKQKRNGVESDDDDVLTNSERRLDQVRRKPSDIFRPKASATKKEHRSVIASKLFHPPQAFFK